MKSFTNKGFTLLEVIIVTVVFLVLVSFLSINLFNLPSGATVSSTVQTLTADMKSQQIKAMAGDTEGRATPDAYGIYFSPNSYTLFHGLSYSPSDTDNFVNQLPAGYSITTTIPSASLVFIPGSGEIANFSSLNNTITVTDTKTSRQKILILNQYGTITSIN